MTLWLRLMVKYMRSFGPWAGLRIALATRKGPLSRVQLPGLRHPMVLRKGTSDLRVFHQVFLFGEYEVPYPRDVRHVVDAGANIGMFAVRMKQRFPLAKVVCIEPDPENLDVLRANVAPYADVAVEAVGLWCREVKLKLSDKYGMGKWGMTVEEDPVNGIIPASSIPAVMARQGWSHIDVLKIDIETSERAVFSEGYQEWLPKVRMIVVELHDNMLPGCAQAFFSAIGACWPSYRYSVSGENTIVRNLSDQLG